MRRLVLAADLSLDGFVGCEGLGTDWPREYDDHELVRYRRRVVLKAGVHALEETWSVDALAELKADGGADELAPIVAEGGPGFCQELTRRGLVDEYRITVHPVVFGDGYRLFAARDRLYLISTHLFVNGTPRAHLRPGARLPGPTAAVPVGPTAGAGRGRGPR